MATKKVTKKEMTLSEIVGARPVLEKLANKEMSAGKALSFAAFVREVLVDIQNFEQERAELFQELGEDQGDGNFIIKPDNEEKFRKAIKEKLDKKVKIKPYKLSDLDISVAPSELINVLPLFE